MSSKPLLGLIRVLKRTSLCYSKTRALMYEYVTRRNFQKLLVLKLQKFNDDNFALRRSCINY